MDDCFGLLVALGEPPSAVDSSVGRRVLILDKTSIVGVEFVEVVERRCEDSIPVAMRVCWEVDVVVMLGILRYPLLPTITTWKSLRHCPLFKALFEEIGPFQKAHYTSNQDGERTYAEINFVPGFDPRLEG
jgi:hypothetical protein